MNGARVSVRRVVIVGSSAVFVAFLLTVTYSLFTGIGWKTESVSGGGWHTVHDMVVDSDGKVHMASLGIPAGSVGYIEETGDGWAITKLYEFGEYSFDYFDVSIAVDSEDRPCICTGKFVQVWEDVFDPHLVVAKNDGNVWVVQDIPVEYRPTSYIVAFDSQDAPCILWTGSNCDNQGYVGLLTTGSVGWANAAVFGPYLGEEATLCSFTVDANDNKHAVIIYRNDTTNQYRLESSSELNGEWVNETIMDGDWDLVKVTSISVDEEGHIHVVLSEWDSTNSSYWLAYLRNVSGEWEKTRVAYAGDTDFSIYHGASIATDSNGGIHVLYYARSVESQNHTVRYAVCESGQWTHRVLDEGAPMSFTSVQVSVCSSDDVHLSYFVDDWTGQARPVPVLTVRSYHDLGDAISPALDSGVRYGALSVVPVIIVVVFYVRYKKAQTLVAPSADDGTPEDVVSSRRDLVRNQRDSTWWTWLKR